MQFGALIAAGHSPNEIGSWTWSQVQEACVCVQAYHMDLLSRVVTGKSPSWEDAQKAARAQRRHARSEPQQAAQQAQGGQDASAPPDVASARREDVSEFMRLREAARADGTMVGVKEARGNAPDLRRAWNDMQRTGKPPGWLTGEED